MVNENYSFINAFYMAFNEQVNKDTNAAHQDIYQKTENGNTSYTFHEAGTTERLEAEEKKLHFSDIVAKLKAASEVNVKRVHDDYQKKLGACVSNLSLMAERVDEKYFSDTFYGKISALISRISNWWNNRGFQTTSEWAQEVIASIKKKQQDRQASQD